VKVALLLVVVAITAGGWIGYRATRPDGLRCYWTEPDLSVYPAKPAQKVCR
jgi:hypothetical protein